MLTSTLKVNGNVNVQESSELIALIKYENSYRGKMLTNSCWKLNDKYFMSEEFQDLFCCRLHLCLSLNSNFC